LAFFLFHHYVEVTSFSFYLISERGLFLTSLLTAKEDMLPPHRTFHFSLSCLKTSSNCGSHTPKQQTKETYQADSQTSSKPSLASFDGLRLAILQHSIENKTTTLKR
jgi:hypothetical protein